jgi:hypothetical protein
MARDLVAHNKPAFGLIPTSTGPRIRDLCKRRAVGRDQPEPRGVTQVFEPGYRRFDAQSLRVAGCRTLIVDKFDEVTCLDG